MINKKYKIITTALLLVFSFSTANLVFSQDPNNRLKNVAGSATYTTIEDARTADTKIAEYVGNIIKYTLSMLGVIFLVLLIYAGFRWMTARGDSEVIEHSKETIRSAVIGLIIILMSYSITFYVVSKIANTTTTGSGFN